MSTLATGARVHGSHTWLLLSLLPLTLCTCTVRLCRMNLFPSGTGRHGNPCLSLVSSCCEKAKHAGTGSVEVKVFIRRQVLKLDPGPWTAAVAIYNSDTLSWKLRDGNFTANRQLCTLKCKHQKARKINK